MVPYYLCLSLRCLRIDFLLKIVLEQFMPLEFPFFLILKLFKLTGPHFLHFFKFIKILLFEINLAPFLFFLLACHGGKLISGSAVSLIFSSAWMLVLQRVRSIWDSECMKEHHFPMNVIDVRAVRLVLFNFLFTILRLLRFLKGWNWPFGCSLCS